MGRSYRFECLKCTYRAIVSGGADEGVDVSVQTARCRDCRKVFDAVVRLRLLCPAAGDGENPEPTSADRVPKFEQIVNRLPLPTSGGFEWMDFPLSCPESPSHEVEPWFDPGKCPVCGSFLEKSGLPFRVWK